MQHGAWFYFIPWLVAFNLMLVTLWGVKQITWFRAPIRRVEDSRTSVAPRYYRLGGMIAAGIFVCLLLIDGRLERHSAYLALVIGTLAVMLFSLADDFWHVRWPWHLLFQTLLGGVVLTAGLHFEVGQYFHILAGLGIAASIGSIVWVMFVMNVINWADGSDGLMPGVVSISFLAIFLLALRPEVNQPTIALLAVMLLGLALGLALFNWYPARFLAGTGGAYFFGYALAVLGLYAGMKVATLLLVLAVPVFDAVFVIARRVLRGHSPFLPDTEHFHHLLLARGWSARRIATVYLLVTGALGLLALSFQGIQKALLFLFVGLLLLALTLSLLGRTKQLQNSPLKL